MRRVTFHLSALILGLLITRAAVIPVDPRATYLRTSNDPQSFNTVPVNLASLGFAAGDDIFLQTEGAYYYSIDRTGQFAGMVAIFSATSSLGPQTTTVRVLDALTTALPQRLTPPTLFGNFPTDVPQDFFVSQDGVSVTIPVGARFLFFSPPDSHFSDNSTDHFALRISPHPAIRLFIHQTELNTHEICWNSVPGATYELQSADALPAFSWNIFTPSISSAGSETCVNIPTTPAMKFFRVLRVR